MIILDTHIWIWWVHGDPQLHQEYLDFIQAYEAQGLGICAISCWEVAKLVERGRLTLPLPVGQWLVQALTYPGIRLLDLSPRVAVESTQLPGTFHRDPADQIIVATARLYRCPLVTMDANIRAYPHVQVAPCSKQFSHQQSKTWETAMQPNLDEAFALVEDEVLRWDTPDEDGFFMVRPESLMEVAAAVGSVEGRELNDRRIIFTLAGRISRAYKVMTPLWFFLAKLAHCVEGLNYPEVDHAKESPVDLYGFEAEVDFPLGGNERVRLYIETYNDVSKAAQGQDPWFLITRQDFNGGQG